LQIAGANALVMLNESGAELMLFDVERRAMVRTGSTCSCNLHQLQMK